MKQGNTVVTGRHNRSQLGNSYIGDPQHPMQMVKVDLTQLSVQQMQQMQQIDVKYNLSKTSAASLKICQYFG